MTRSFAPSALGRVGELLVVVDLLGALVDDVDLVEDLEHVRRPRRALSSWSTQKSGRLNVVIADAEPAVVRPVGLDAPVGLAARTARRRRPRCRTSTSRRR